MNPTSPNGDAAAPIQALIVRPPQALSPYEPSDYEQALAMAKTFAESKLCKVQTAAAAFMVMATGKSLGVPPETALRTFHVIDGVVCLPAQIMVALCLRRGDLCEWFDCVESTEERATYEAKRHGRPPQRETYTIAQAQRAGRVRDRSPWQTDPASMLIARASSRLARRTFPDILAGLYTMDEVQDGDHEPAPMAAVTPIGGAPPPPQDAAPETDEAREARFAAALRAAPDKDAATLIGNEIMAAWPDKDAPPRKRLHAVFKEVRSKGAGGKFTTEAPMKPPADPAADREPGAEG